MHKELILGFDCREMWKPESEVKNWPDTSYLLKSDVSRILSVNQRFWQTVFLPPAGKYSLAAQSNTAPGYNLTIPDEWRAFNEFWRDLVAMRDFISDNTDEYQKRCWMIAITIVETPVYLRGTVTDVAWFPPIEAQEFDSQWTLLGYDIEDASFFNGGIGGVNWIEEYQAERRRLWGNRLNRYYLFPSQQDAIEYADWHTAQTKGSDGRLLVFGLYLIQEFP